MSGAGRRGGWLPTSRHELLTELVLAEIIGRRGEGPLALRGPLGRAGLPRAPLAPILRAPSPAAGAPASVASAAPPGGRPPGRTT